MCQSMVNIQSPTAEIRRGKKKKERRNRMKIYMVSLLHRATINQWPGLLCHPCFLSERRCLMTGSLLHILSIYIPLFCYAFKVTIDYSCHASVFCAIGGRVICQMAVMQTSVSNISNWSYLWNSYSAADEIWHFYITHLSKVNFSIPIFCQLWWWFGLFR